MGRWLICLLLFLGASSSAQQRLLVTPNNEVIPLKRIERNRDRIGGGALPTPADAACSDRFPFGYSEELFPPNSNFGCNHKDVMGEWFIVPASGKIETIYWEALGSVGALDSLVLVRIFRSNIHPGRGPGFPPYRPPCRPWGYFRNSNDLDEGITPFKDEATDTSWVSTTFPDDSLSFNPLGEQLWGGAGVGVIDHANHVNRVAIGATGDSLRVNSGDVLFVTIRINSPNSHPPDSLDHRTEFAASGFRVTRFDEHYPSRFWKFYEHDQSPSNCSSLFTYPNGWISRGGFGSDSLDVAVWNLWYSMTVTSNVPPMITYTSIPTNWFDKGPFTIEADIIDCDPANPGRAGISKAELTWSIDGVEQTTIEMSHEGGDIYAAALGPISGCARLISYRVSATDSGGLEGFGVRRSFTILCSQHSSYTIDTAASCEKFDISGLGVVIPDSAYFLPPTSPPNTSPLDNGTAGPIDIGGEMGLFGHQVRYAWIGVDGAMALSHDATDTLDVNSNGAFNANWSLPYNSTLRTGRDTSTTVAASMPENFIAPFWDNLTLRGKLSFGHGRIRYLRYPGGNTCLFVTEWDSVGPACETPGSCADFISKFRVVLNRCDGTVGFQYDSVGLDTLSTMLLVGMQGQTQSEYVFLNLNGQPARTTPRNNWCVKFYPDATTDVHHDKDIIPATFCLFQNYPNPFNPQTVISYQLSVNSFATLSVFDVLGRETAVLVNEQKAPGDYSVSWDACNYPSGVYFYKLRAGSFTEVKKLLLIR